MSDQIEWKVEFSKKAKKQKASLSQKSNDMIDALIISLKKNGPIQKEWPNFSSLGKTTYHCHLNKKGRPIIN